MDTIRNLYALKILLSIRSHPEYYPSKDNASDPTTNNEIDILVKQGLIQKYDRTWECTDKGKFFIDHLLATPLPVVKFEIPERE
jgi:coproporphyrinogen III oxidase-like Fe-S oxidoreductase